MIDLTQHVGELGATYTQTTGPTDLTRLKVDDGYLFWETELAESIALVKLSGVPNNANYMVRGIFEVPSIESAAIRLCARFSDQNNYVGAAYGAGFIALGAFSQAGSNVVGPSINVSNVAVGKHVLELRVVDNTAIMIFDGVERCVLDITAAALTAKHHVAIGLVGKDEAPRSIRLLELQAKNLPGLNTAGDVDEGEIDLCIPVEGFTWASFINHLSVANIETTLKNPAYDNVQLNVTLGGPLDAWSHFADDPDKVDGSIGESGLTIHTIPFALKLTNNQPDYDTLAAPRANLYSDPVTNPYQNVADSYLFTTKYGFRRTAFENETQTLSMKGIAVTGEGDMYWNGYAQTAPMWHEAWFSSNPDSVNTTEKFSGYTWFYDSDQTNLAADSGDASLIDEWRIGYIGVDDDITDPAFDGSTLRLGVWLKANGANFDISVYSNGAIVESTSLPFTTGLNQANFYPVFDSAPNTALDGFASAAPIVNIDTDTDSWLSTLGDDNHYLMLNMACVKYAQYIKPNPSNNVGMTFYQQYTMITDPRYAA